MHELAQKAELGCYTIQNLEFFVYIDDSSSSRVEATPDMPPAVEKRI